MEELQIPENQNNLSSASGRRKGLRPEIMMAGIAVLAAVLVAVMAVLALPYMVQDEDPETLKQHRPVSETQPVQILEPTISETQPETPEARPDVNPYGRFDFQYNRQNYLVLQNVTSYPGVDVSSFQGEIDWEAVKASGIEFAMIRLGYRGYSTGKLVEDDYARANLEGARAAGLRVGVYFFSQALNIKEADEEIRFMLNVLGDTPLDMPMVLDWEIPDAKARTRNMDARMLTDIQRHFCGEVRKLGYTPMIYFNWNQSEKLYHLTELEDAPFWLAFYQDRMTFPWKVEMWQWTQTGSVPGIQGNVDINVYMPH